MTTRIRKVITAIDASGNAFSEVHSETQVGERWFPNDPTSLSVAGPEASAWQEQFNSAVSSELDTLKSTHNTTLEELAAITVERDMAQKQAESLTEQVARIEGLLSRIDELLAERDELLSRVPPEQGPRQLTPNEFMIRMLTVAPQHVREIWTSDSEAAAMASVMLFTTIGLIDLDSPKLAELLKGLIAAGLLSQTERDEILK